MIYLRATVYMLYSKTTTEFIQQKRNHKPPMLVNQPTVPPCSRILKVEYSEILIRAR